jgi:hypothetical protein
MNADGLEIHQLVANGNVDQVEFTPRFTQSNGSHQVGDLLWTTYYMKIASRRFIDVLQLD